MFRKCAVTLLSISILLSCSKLPGDLTIYVISDFVLAVHSDNSWKTIMTLNKRDGYVFTSIAINNQNKMALALRNVDKLDSKLIIYNAIDHRVLSEQIIDSIIISSISFNKCGNVIAMLSKKASLRDNSTISTIDLSNNAVKVISVGNYNAISYGYNDLLYFSKTDKQDNYVGYFDISKKYPTENIIAEGSNITSSIYYDSIMFINSQNKLETVVNGRTHKIIHYPINNITNIKYVSNTADTISASPGIKTDSLYLVAFPYTTPLNIVRNWPVLDFVAIKKR